MIFYHNQIQTKPMKSSIVVLLLAASPAICSAATTFAIDAGNDGWAGWTEVLTSVNGSENGTFLGGAANGSNINTTGSFGTVSWSLYANSGQTASRFYDFSSILTTGQSVSLAMDNGSIDTGGTVGFSLQNSGGTNRFEYYYIGGDSVNSYKINDAGGQENVTPNVGFTSTGLVLSFTQLAADSYSFSINGNPITNTGLSITASDISRIRLFNFNAGGGNDAHFNSLAVVPEPSAALLGGLGAIILLRRRRNR